MNKKQITFAVIFSIVFIQIFRIEKTNPIVEENKNFISLSHSNDDINKNGNKVIKGKKTLSGSLK